MSFTTFNTFQTDSCCGTLPLGFLKEGTATITTNPLITRTSYLEPSNGKEYWVYIFTDINTPYTMSFTNVKESIPISILAIGGGGAGSGAGDGGSGSGGGAGGLVETYKYISSDQNINITIGPGGEYNNPNAPNYNLYYFESSDEYFPYNGNSGSNTIVSSPDFSITALGGGGGGYFGGFNGGSGGGGYYLYLPGNSTQLSSEGYGLGNNGMNAGSEYGGTGGGGGAGGQGIAGINYGNGGIGVVPHLMGIPNTNSNGLPIYYAGGGAGGFHEGLSGIGGIGGLGGGGAAGNGINDGISGTPNTGGGGGGGGSYFYSYENPVIMANGGSGGSGLVIISIPKENII